MLLKSDVTGNEYNVKLFTNDDGTKGICHESLQDILENQLAGIDYDIDVHSASASYFAASCTIRDLTTGRKVVGYNDVNMDAYDGKDGRQAAFAAAHPMITAIQAAVDMAVRAYLQWPRTIGPVNVSAGAYVISDKPNIPDDIYEPEEPDAASEAALIEAANAGRKPEEEPEKEIPKEEPEKETGEADDPGTAENEETAETDMPAEEDVPFDPTSVLTGAADHPDVLAGAMNPPEEGAETEDSRARLQELGIMHPPANSKYGKKTFDEIWESNRGWFAYIMSSNKSKTYETAREYANLKQAISGEQL